MAKTITVDAINNKRYVIEGPDDITDDEIDAHIKLAMEKDAAHEAKTGFGPHFKKGLISGTSELGRGASVVAEELGLPGAAQTLKGYSEEAAKRAQEVAEPTTEEDVKAAEAQGFLSGAKAKTNKAVLEPTAEAGGRFAPAITAGIIDAPIATAVALAGETGAGIGAAKEAGASNKAAIAAGPVLGAISTYGLPGTGAAAKMVAGDVGKTVLGSAAKNATAGVATAVPASIGYQSVLSAAADKPQPTLEEMGEIAKDTSIPAAVLGGVHGATNVTVLQGVNLFHNVRLFFSVSVEYGSELYKLDVLWVRRKVFKVFLPSLTLRA